MAAPWHMWGSNQVVQVNPTGAAGIQNITTPQLASVQYGRPETWSFFFWAQAELSYSAIIAGTILSIQFRLTLGLGRTQITLPLFENYAVTSLDPNPRRLIYSNTVHSPERGTIFPTDPITHLTAQSIQIDAFLVNDNGGAIASGSCELGAWVAPRTHVRPEWMMDGDPKNFVRFRGGEQAGS